MSTLTTYTNYSSVLIESDISLYRTEPDVQHNDDTNGDNCIQSSILHYPDDELIYRTWEYNFNKALMNAANIIGLIFIPSISPDYQWINWSENSTHIMFTGVATDSIHATLYNLTIEALNQTDNTQVDIVSVFFSISSNDLPEIGILQNKIIEIGTCETWTLDSDAITDAENDPFTTSILVNGSATLPSWLTYDPSYFTFNA